VLVILQNPKFTMQTTMTLPQNCKHNLYLVNNTTHTHAHAHAHMHTRTHAHSCFTALWILSGITQVSWYQKKHSPTFTYHGHQSSLSASSVYYDPWHPPCSIYVPDSLFPQSVSKFSSIYLLAWRPLYISIPNHCLHCTTHAHTITTCFAVVPRLYHLILGSLSNLYLELYLVL